MKKEFLKIKSWKIMLGGTIFQLLYTLSIFLYLFIANSLNLQIGSQALVWIIIMIYSAIFSFIGLIFIFLFLIKNKVIKKIFSVISILLGIGGLIVSFIPKGFFIPLSFFLIWAGIQAWKE